MPPKSAPKTSRRAIKNLRRLRNHWPVWIFLACWWHQVAAQTAPPNSVVKDVRVQHVGPASVSNQMVRANIQTRQGDAFSAARIDQDVKNLLGTGYFYNVDVAWDVGEDGIELVYSVQGKPTLTEIRFEGNERLKDRRLKKKVTSKVGDPIDERKLFTDAREIQTLYQKKGYQDTKVEYVPSIIENRGQGSVTFKVTEAPRVRIEEVRFEGARAFRQKRLIVIFPSGRIARLTARGLRERRWQPTAIAFNHTRFIIYCYNTYSSLIMETDWELRRTADNSIWNNR